MVVATLKRGTLVATATAVLATAVLPTAASQARSTNSTTAAVASVLSSAHVQHKAKKRRNVHPDGSIITNGRYGVAGIRG